MDGEGVFGYLKMSCYKFSMISVVCESVLNGNKTSNNIIFVELGGGVDDTLV